MADINLMNRMTVSSVETYLDSLFRGSLTNNLFFGGLPSKIDSSWTSMVVVDCGSAINDMDAYGKGTVLIMLYAKPNAYGKKDVKTLQTLEQTLNRLVNNANDSHYHLSRRSARSNYDNSNGSFVNIITLNLLIS